MICEECGAVGKVHVHHKDGNHDNDIPENRATLCPSCHRRRHVDMLIESTGRPSTRAIPERLPVDWEPEPLPWAEVRRQYFACFPRA